MQWYYILLILFVSIGGFEYNVGSDMPGYMFEYYAYDWNSINKISDLAGFRHRQPGWVLINLVFRSISADFSVFQFFNAFFFNTVCFSFMRKHSKYFFLSVLYFAIVIYLNLNFNILRQGYAISLFLIGYDYLRKNNYLVYYLYVFLAFLFHTSALILFVIPFFMLIKYDIKTLIILGIISVGLLFAVLNGLFDNLITSFFSEMLTEEGALKNIGDAGEKFMSSQYEREDGGMSLIGLIWKIVSIGFILFVGFYYSKHNGDNKAWLSIMILYVICVVMDMIIPVMFVRFLYYFYIFYFCSLSFCVIEISSRLSLNRLITVLLCLYFTIAPVRELFAVNASSGISLISQFYPYHSIFDKEIDPVRAANFGSHK